MAHSPEIDVAQLNEIDVAQLNEIDVAQLNISCNGPGSSNREHAWERITIDRARGAEAFMRSLGLIVSPGMGNITVRRALLYIGMLTPHDEDIQPKRKQPRGSKLMVERNETRRPSSRNVVVARLCNSITEDPDPNSKLGLPLSAA